MNATKAIEAEIIQQRIDWTYLLDAFLKSDHTPDFLLGVGFSAIICVIFSVIIMCIAGLAVAVCIKSIKRRHQKKEEHFYKLIDKISVTKKNFEKCLPDGITPMKKEVKA